ncbi:uncharacterized protein LOC117513412 [Thalassophryne amazonica]|uniref:uncharacterized protein LOC117513412 n=1 Tax=Thalassophryne amazonica TaxID=390379 RepID=UPI001471C581|nr:uncharacterized protein LOC117513412 [Thalassophryne amazonica]
MGSKVQPHVLVVEPGNDILSANGAGEAGWANCPPVDMIGCRKNRLSCDKATEASKNSPLQEETSRRPDSVERTSAITAWSPVHQLTWYRQVEEQPSAVIKGLLSKKLPNGTIQRYNGIERHVDLLGNTGDLFLPNVTYSDSGIYVCHLAAPVGEQNQESQVHLILRGCPENPPNKVMLDAYAVIFATLLLITSLVIFVWSYRCLKKAMKERNESSKKEILLNVSSIPLEKKDLEMIYTLGPKWSKPHWTHTCL